MKARAIMAKEWGVMEWENALAFADDALPLVLEWYIDSGWSIEELRDLVSQRLDSLSGSD